MNKINLEKGIVMMVNTLEVHYGTPDIAQKHYDLIMAITKHLIPYWSEYTCRLSCDCEYEEVYGIHGKGVLTGTDDDKFKAVKYILDSFFEIARKEENLGEELFRASLEFNGWGKLESGLYGSIHVNGVITVASSESDFEKILADKEVEKLMPYIDHSLVHTHLLKMNKGYK